MHLTHTKSTIFQDKTDYWSDVHKTTYGSCSASSFGESYSITDYSEAIHRFMYKLFTSPELQYGHFFEANSDYSQTHRRYDPTGYWGDSGL